MFQRSVAGTKHNTVTYSSSLFEEAQQYGYRNRNKSDDGDDCDKRSGCSNQLVVFRMIESYGLEHAPAAVEQVQTQGGHRHDIKGRGVPHVETTDHVVVNVAGMEIRMHNSDREMKKVVDDKNAEDWASPSHRA